MSKNARKRDSVFLSEEMFPSNVVGFGTQHGSPHGDHVVSWSFEKCSRKDMRSASTPAENYVNTLPDVAFKRRRLYSIGSSRDDEGGADGIRREPVEAAGRENTEQLGASNRTAFRQGTRECWLGPHLYSNTLQSDVRDSKFVSQQVLSSDTSQALVQLKIDAMFAGEGSTKQIRSAGELQGIPKCSRDSSMVPGAEEMQLEPGVTEKVSGKDQQSCYVCQGAVRRDDGHVLCPFCDRITCEGCSQSCSSCQNPHCRLCLCTDFSTQFEHYLCPSCHRERSHNRYVDAADMVI